MFQTGVSVLAISYSILYFRPIIMIFQCFAKHNCHITVPSEDNKVIRLSLLCRQLIYNLFRHRIIYSCTDIQCLIHYFFFFVLSHAKLRLLHMRWSNKGNKAGKENTL